MSSSQQCPRMFADGKSFLKSFRQSVSFEGDTWKTLFPNFLSAPYKILSGPIPGHFHSRLGSWRSFSRSAQCTCLLSLSLPSPPSSSYPSPPPPPSPSSLNPLHPTGPFLAPKWINLIKYVIDFLFSMFLCSGLNNLKIKKKNVKKNPGKKSFCSQDGMG